MPKISIIIPVYNTEKYIEKCFESVKSQVFKDLEIIVVDDGSNDNSKQVINNWQEKNKDINCKYFYKENGGLSSARNYGILEARGDYIMFLDSDDYLDVNLFTRLENSINEEADVIKFKMIKVAEDGSIIQKVGGPIFKKCSGEEALKQLIGNDNFMDVACIYLYKREYFLRYKFEYNIVNKYHEDFGLTPIIIANAKSFISTDVYGYYYIQTKNSITRNEDYNKTIQKAYDVLAHYDNMITKLKEYEISNISKNLLKSYYTNTVILKTNELKAKEKKQYIRQIRKRKMYKNIKATNLKQLLKKIILMFSISLYLKMR